MAGSFQIKTVVVTPGVTPPTDFTPQSITQATFSDKVRFIDGFPQKIGGWKNLLITGNYSITSIPRNIYSYIQANVTYYLVASYRSLYSIQGNTLYNATPVQATGSSHSNILGTVYGDFPTDPFFVNQGINVVTVTDPGHPFLTGDAISISGATTFAGLASGDLNGAKTISNVGTDTYQFTTTTTPTSAANGGGASVVRASRLIMVTLANTYQDGDNIDITSVGSAVGGISAANIEGIRVVRAVTPTGFDVVANAFATSSASAAGGTTTIISQIPPGQLNSTTGSGYGLGLYGVGLYGVSKISTTPIPPTIWSFDRFGNLVVMTPGNQTGLYSWDSTTDTVPALVSGAPTAINYTFVTDNICVTLGASNTPNRVQWCDQGNLNTWTTTSENQAGTQDIYGAGELISAAAIQGWNLLFTKNQVYTFRYIGLPFVFEIKLVDPAHGLIAQQARVVVNGVCYWMGIDNFYMWSGGNVEIVPSNTTNRCTLLNYIFKNVNYGNSAKIFCWYNSAFNEIWWHYPSANATECDSVARFNILDHTWVPDTMNRTAAEYPVVQSTFPYLASPDAGITAGAFSDGWSDGFETEDDNGLPAILLHENGTDDNEIALPFEMDSPYFTSGANVVLLGGVYQDNILTTGNLNWTINTKLYPNQTPDTVTYAILADNQNLIYRRRGRYWQYNIAGNTLGQYWRGGAWQELYKSGGTK